MTEDKDFNVGRTLFENYSVKSVISKDNIATVYLTKDLSNGNATVLKTLNFLKSDILNSFTQAIEKQLKISHDQVVITHGMKKSPAGRVFLIMEYIEGVSLKEVIDSNGKFCNEHEIFGLFNQICKLLEEFHEREIVHGNISSNNIILMEVDGNVVIKLTDFFMGEVKSIISLDRDIAVDLSFASPELLDLRDPTKKSDVYSLALVLYATICGELPDLQNIKPVSELNPEISNSEILDQLFSNSFKQESKERLSGMKEFREVLESWIEIIRQEEEERRLELEQAQKEKEEQEQLEALEELKELKKSVHDIVSLKQKVFSQEETMAMKFSEIASKGARQSPVKAARKIVVSVVSCIALFAALTYSFIKFEEPIRKAWKESSRNVSASVFKKDRGKPTENEVASKNRLKATMASNSSPLIKDQDKVKAKINSPQKIKKTLKKKNPFYYEELPAESLIIKRPYHPPAGRNVSAFTNNVR